MCINAVTGEKYKPRSKSQIDYTNEKLTFVIKNNKHMSRKHDLKINRALNENTLILNYNEKISIKNKKTEIISLSRINCKCIPNKTTISVILN